MSCAAPWGRVTPRWSVAGATSEEASTAGLVSAGRCVGVGPSLSPSAPSCGSALDTTEPPKPLSDSIRSSPPVALAVPPPLVLLWKSLPPTESARIEPSTTALAVPSPSPRL